MCFPSLGMESCGRVLLEAIAHRRPVVASDIGSVPEIISDGETGFLFEPGNSHDLAEKAVRLLEDLALCRRMASNIDSIAHLYSPARHYEQITAVYEACMRSH